MQPPRKKTKPHPALPSAFSFPLKVLPSFIHNKVLAITLNRIFADELKDGELDFLQHKLINIAVEDTGLEYRLTLDENRLSAGSKEQTPDLFLKGTLYDYMLLASRREDADALFFNRQLKMQGDTELGLYVKNFLDGLDLDSHKTSVYLEALLQKSLPVYERLFS
jgi:O2-independent ubiquinone biosynthesis accessory factor UbiT